MCRCTHTQCVVHRPAISSCHWWVWFRNSGEKQATAISVPSPGTLPSMMYGSCTRRITISTHLRPDFVGIDFRSLHVVLQDPYSPLTPESASCSLVHLTHRMFWLLLTPESFYTLGIPHWRPWSLFFPAFLQFTQLGWLSLFGQSLVLCPLSAQWAQIS
jgi:hypothetical protein